MRGILHHRTAIDQRLLRETNKPRSLLDPVRCASALERQPGLRESQRMRSLVRRHSGPIVLVMSALAYGCADGDQDTRQWTVPALLDGELASFSGVEVFVGEGGRATAVWGSATGLYSARFAPPTGWDVPKLIVEHRYATVVSAAMSRDGDDVVVAWSHERNHYVSRVQSGGEWREPIRLGSDDEYAATVDVDVNDAGRGMVLYSTTSLANPLEGVHEPGNELRTRIWALRLHHNGWSAPELIADATSVPQEQFGVPIFQRPAVSIPRVSVDTEGVATAVWGFLDVGRQDLVARRRDPDTGWSPPHALGLGPGDPYSDPSLVASETARAVVLGGDNRAGVFAPDTGWRIDTVDADGVRLVRPRLALNRHGEAVAVYERFRNDDARDIVAIRLDAQGRWSAPEVIGETSPNRCWFDGPFSDVAINDRGDVVAVWRRHGNADVTDCADSDLTLWTNRFRPGAGWSTPLQLSSNGVAVRQPRVGMDEQGRALAVWEQNILRVEKSPTGTPGTDPSLWWSRLE
jgi:hypothetical protein